MRRWVAGVAVILVVLVASRAIYRTTAGQAGSRQLVSDAAFPAAMAALADGGLLYGERLTGRVVRVDTDGATEVIGVVSVSTEGEQRGLLGLAVRGDDVFVSFTGASGRLQVGVLGGDTVWEGPPSATEPTAVTSRSHPMAPS